MPINRFYNNQIDLIPGTKIRAAAVEAHYTAIDNAFYAVQLELDALDFDNVAAFSLQTTGAPVNVGDADPPTTGQVLTATSATTSEWSDFAASGGGVATSTTNVFTKNQSVSSVALNSVFGSLDTDASLSNYFTILVQEDITMNNPTNLTDGMILTWRFVADEIWVVSYGSKFKFPGGTAMTPTSAPSGVLGISVDVLTGIYNAEYDVIDCNFLQDFK